MPKFLKIVFIMAILNSACVLWADNTYQKDFFLSQKVTVYGLAGIPWETTSSIDEERSRAWMDALHHAYEEILRLPLMEGKLVKNVIQTNPALKERLRIALLSAPKTFYEQDSSGLLRCKVELPFSGKFSLRSCLYLAALRPKSMKPKSFLASWSSEISYPDEDNPPEVQRIVVDVRSSNFEPSIFPRFFDQKGFLVFQEAMVPVPDRFSRPTVRYTTEIKEAYQGLEQEQIMVIEARVPELAQRDISIAQSESSIFRRFCRELIINPQGKNEIVVVFSGNGPERGKLPMLEKKEAKSKK